MSSNQSDPMARKAYYLEHFRRNRAAILEAAAMGLDPSIKGCPGWDVAALTGHMGRVYTFWLKWVRERPRAHSQEARQELLADRDTRLPGYNEWESAGFPRNARPDGIVDFARRAGEDLDSALEVLNPRETVWTFVPGNQSGAFVFRRIAMETAIHRWDAEEAHGIAQPIEEDLAWDGIDEILSLYEKDPGFEVEDGQRRGQRVLLCQDPGPGRWLVSFDEDGIRTVPAATDWDVTIYGTASDLMLFTQGRLMAREMRVEGDDRVAASWGDLAGRF